MNYVGTIIEESLKDKSILEHVKILDTEVEEVTDHHQTQWLKQWTLHKVEIPEEKVKDFSQRLSLSLDRDHQGSWYVDYKNDQYHYIIFRNKIFQVDLQNPVLYEEAKNYGLALGIPEHQVDFKLTF